VYILSAGWGLIPAAFLIPAYDITFSSQAEAHQRRRRDDLYRDWSMLPEATTDAVFFFGCVVLPQSYSAGRVIRIPVAPQTVGDHIRKRRLALKMLQKDVAEQLGVDKTSVFNWEANTSAPEIRYMPAIIRFLGYNPLPEGDGWGERLVRHRTSLGMTQKEAASRLAVDQGTLAKWEQGKREPAGTFLGRVKRFVQDGNVSGARRAG
jgi:transcriptional regulator with XRE-family HTH domain